MIIYNSYKMNIFKILLNKIKEARIRREWRKETFAKKNCAVFKISNNYKVVSCFYDKSSGWMLLDDPVHTISDDQPPMVLGEAVTETLKQPNVKKFGKEFFSKEREKEWLKRNFKLRSFNALHKNSLCDIILYKDDFIVSPTRKADDGRGWVCDKEREKTYSYSSLTSECIGKILISLTANK